MPLPASRRRVTNNNSHQAQHGLELVKADTPAAPGGWLAMWHLLSLDAPTVAVVWTLFLARSAGVSLPWESPVAMFAAVWMLYAADRLLDSRPLADGSARGELEARHLFHLRNRKRFLAGIVSAGVVLAAMLPRMDAETLRLDCLLGSLLAAWLLLIHLLPEHGANAHRLPKELAVGVCFPAAVFIPTVSRIASPVHTLLASAIFLGVVCTLNCLFIYAWEHPDLRSASWSTRWAARHLMALVGATLAASLVAIGLSHSELRVVATACVLSAAGLALLHKNRLKWKAVNLRAAADLCLLSPLLVILALKLMRA